MRPPLVWLALLLAASALFLLAPGIDLAVSGWFYEPQQGFALAGWPPARLLDRAIPWLTGAILILCAAAALYLWRAGRPLWRLDRKALAFIVAALALGPGLVANTVLKDHWGRARPAQIAAFGGGREFTAAPLPAAQCTKNCAFVSGHAALGFSLVSFALLLPAGQRRRLAIGAALGFGALVGLARIAEGRHFLSDVVFAGLLMVGICWLLYRWIVERDALFGPAARRFYRALGDLPPRPIALWAAALAGFEAVAIVWLDRPTAEFFHRIGVPWRATALLVTQFGFGTPYLIAFALAFVVLRWGGNAPPLRPWAAAMRAAARVPAFLFAALALSGLLVDALKPIFGRTRPGLLFAGGTYDFSWFGLRADHWSFPSGHAETAAALMTALWCLWPRPLPFYVLGTMLVAASRLLLGAHYLSDVAMGCFIGVVVTRALAERMLPRRPVALAPVVERAAAGAAPPA